MRPSTAILLILSLLSVVTPQQTFDITSTGQAGVALNQMTCNVQSIIDFKFNSSSIISGMGTTGLTAVIFD